MHPRNSRLAGRDGAFTLVEMLVVIAIIALLISILLPVLSRARRAADRAACLVKLRGIGTAIVMYTAEHKGVMPPILQRHWSDPPLATGGPGLTWAGILKDQFKMPKESFRCPGDKRDDVWTDASFEVGSAFDTLSYGAILAGYANPARRVVWSTPVSNYFPPEGQGPFNISRARKSSSIILVWDAHTSVFSNGAGMIPLVADLIAYRDFWNDTVFRHSPHPQNIRQGPNAVYADGHAEQTINVTVLTDDDVTILR